MFRKRLLTLLFLFYVSLFLSNNISAETADITLQEIIANIKKSVEQIEDFEGVFVCKMSWVPEIPGEPSQAQTFNVITKGLDKMLLRYSEKDYTTVIKDGYSYLYLPQENVVTKTKLSLGEGPHWPSMESMVKIITDNVDIAESYLVGEDKIDNRQMYTLTLQFPDMDRKDIFFIDKENWLPIRQEVYMGGKLILENEFKEFSINKGIADDIFDKELPKDAHIEEVAFLFPAISPGVAKISNPYLLKNPPGISELEEYLIGYEIPIYPGAYEVEKKPFMELLPVTKIISYKVKVAYPSKEVLDFYENIFSEEGWQPFEQPEQGTREWEEYIDGNKEGNPHAARIGDWWADEDKQYMIFLRLRHFSKPFEKELTDEEIVTCSISPYSRTLKSAPVKEELIEIPGGEVEEWTFIEKDGRVIEEKIIIGDDVRKKEEQELLQRALDWYNERDFFNSLELFQEFLRDYPRSDSISFVKHHISYCLKEIAYIYMKQGLYRKAIANFKKYLEASEEPEVRGRGYYEPDARVYFDMGQCYEKLKDYNRAIEVYNEGIFRCPKNKIMGAYIMHRVMSCHEILGQDEEALVAAQKLKQLYPEEDILLDEKTGEWGYSDKIADEKIRQLKKKIIDKIMKE